MRPVLVIGEALVDFICERHVASWDETDAFVPHFGGAPANVAVTAARLGTRIALAGGAGDDPWGTWLARRLREEKIDLTWFGLTPSVQTPLSFVSVDSNAEPHYDFHGGRLAPGIPALAQEIEGAVDVTEALFFTSNSLLEEDERAVTMAARARALTTDKPVVYDPNLRLARWTDPEAAIATARGAIDGALLVKSNRAEAELLTGEGDPERAAAALVAAGAASAVVTLGPDGAISAGATGTASTPGTEAQPLCTTGAGDTVSGVLIAALADAQWDAASIAEALPKAVEAAARATERWGGVA